jgi:formiminotetrahydrofolate cyclodeaminase
MGAALLAMVARITLEAARLAAVHPAAQAVVADADRLRAAFTAARAEDEAAYGAVVTAMGMPRSTDAEKAVRTERLQAALATAAAAPLAVAELAAEAMGVAERAAALDNRNLMSDVECAVAFLVAAYDASAANVRVNHAYLKDAATIAAQRDRLQRSGEELQRAAAAARAKF